MVEHRQIKSISEDNKMRAALISESLIKAFFWLVSAMKQLNKSQHENPFILPCETLAIDLKVRVPGCLIYVFFLSYFLFFS